MIRLSNLLTTGGAGILLFSATVLTITFYPVISTEINYFFNKPPKGAQVISQSAGPSENAIVPIDENFGLVIPKINANASVIANVDPNSEQVYQSALTRGVAHAKGTALPDQNGNVFLFSHSSVNFWQAARYNSIFYLLTKLEAGDDVFVLYKGKKYIYKVVSNKIVDSSEVNYLNGQWTANTLTLMTCWPPGTTLKRFLVTAELES